MSEESDKIAMFMEVSGLGYDVAKQTLSINNFNLEQAMNFHLERVANGDDFSTYNNDQSQNGNNAESSASMASTSTENAYHPIDAEDAVRAPIPPKREQIILPEEDNFRIRKKRAQAPRSVCPLRNFELEGRLQEAEIEAAVFSELNGFESSNDSNGLFGVSSTAPNTTAPPLATVSDTNRIKKTTNTAIGQSAPSRLSELFRPPVDISFCGSFQAARDYAKDKNRWLIVNVQDNKDFSCQVLNRDIWSNERLREVLKEYFVFWQVATDNTDGHRYQVFYDIKIFPYIGIIDPRTGEEKCSHKNGFSLNVDQFMEELQEYLRANTAHPNMEQAVSEKNVIENIEFLNKKSSNNASSSSPQKSKKRKLDIEPSSLSEQEQIELAMRNSLIEIDSGSNSKNNYSNDEENDDDDEEDDADDDENEFDDFDDDDDNVKVNEQSNLDDIKEAIQLSKVNEVNAEVESAKIPDEIEETYTSYLGPDDDPKTRIQLRLPNGDREIIEWPSTTKIKALKLYIPYKYSKITSDGPYKVICPFTIGNVGNNVLDLDDTQTLQDANLFPTVMLHLRNDDY